MGQKGELLLMGGEGAKQSKNVSTLRSPCFQNRQSGDCHAGGGCTDIHRAEGGHDPHPLTRGARPCAWHRATLVL